MADSPRIDELKRRVQSDPASIAFAALAEEYRRAGRFEEAIETCAAGLVRHPSYLSAHVTLGRALIEVGRLPEAREELEYVLKLAPENLAAIRGLAEIHHRLGDDETYPADSPVEEPVAPVPQPVAPAYQEVAYTAPATELPQPEPEVTFGTAPDAGSPIPAAAAAGDVRVDYRPPVDPALAGLEGFLSAIVRARAGRAAVR